MIHYCMDGLEIDVNSAMVNSEGAMVASRYHHPALDKPLRRRILNPSSCNFSYFVSCKNDARISG